MSHQLPASGKMLDVLDLAKYAVDEAQAIPLRAHPELTLRDEANALTARAFRNGYLEDLHAGRRSPLLVDPGVPRVSDHEMKKLMVESSARLAHLLYLRELLLDERPDVYFAVIEHLRWRFTRRWGRVALACEAPEVDDAEVLVCVACGTPIDETWRFCPACGEGLEGEQARRCRSPGAACDARCEPGRRRRPRRACGRAA